MKTTLLILITTIGFVAQVFSQDTLFLNSGKMILGKVTEVGTDQVKYKKPERMDGPLYVVNKSDIVSIRYSDGSRDSFSTDPFASSTPSMVMVHVSGQDDQSIPLNNSSNTNVIGGPVYGKNDRTNQVLNAVVVGAEVLALNSLSHGGHRRRCSTYHAGSASAGLAVPIIIGLVELATHIK